VAKTITITGILVIYCGFFAAVIWNFLVSSNVLETEDLQFLFETMTGIGLDGSAVREVVRDALMFDFAALKAGLLVGSVVAPLVIMMSLYIVVVLRRMESVQVPAAANAFFVYNQRQPIRVTTADPTTGLPIVYAVRIDLLSRSRSDLLTLSGKQDALRSAFAQELDRLNSEALVQVPQMRMEASLLEAGRSVVDDALSRVRIRQSWFEEKEEAPASPALSDAA